MAESTGAGGKTRGRGFFIFLIGLALGVLGAVLLPGLLGPYLPTSLQGSEETLAGLVTAKERQDDKLLLTVDSQRGAVLATFSRKVAEISLLVDEGDSVTLAVRLVEPFVEDPTIREVHKARSRQAPARLPEEPPGTSEPGAGRETPADTAQTRPPIEEPQAESQGTVFQDSVPAGSIR